MYWIINLLSKEVGFTASCADRFLAYTSLKDYYLVIQRRKIEPAEITWSHHIITNVTRSEPRWRMDGLVTFYILFHWSKFLTVLWVSKLRRPRGPAASRTPGVSGQLGVWPGLPDGNPAWFPWQYIRLSSNCFKGNAELLINDKYSLTSLKKYRTVKGRANLCFRDRVTNSCEESDSLKIPVLTQQTKHIFFIIYT